MNHSNKIYYSISEVSELLNISISKIRFLEKEFKQLKPKRSGRGTRQFTKKDIEIIKQIIFLIDVQKFTLNGAKKELSGKQDKVEIKNEINSKLQNIKNKLQQMIDVIDELDKRNS